MAKKAKTPKVSWYEYKRLREYQKHELQLAYEGLGIELMNLSMTYARVEELDMQSVGEYEQARGKIIGEALVLITAIAMAEEEIATARKHIAEEMKGEEGAGDGKEKE